MKRPCKACGGGAGCLACEMTGQVIRVGRGGAGRGQGNKAGSHRVAEPRSFKSTQRYTEAQRRLLEEVAGGPDSVGAFIHDAAVDRAQQFADQGLDVRHQAIYEGVEGG